MSSTATHSLTRTPTPFALGQAARRRLGENAGFDKLVDDGEDETASAAPQPSRPSPAAKPRTAASVNASDAPETPSSDAGGPNATTTPIPQGAPAPTPAAGQGMTATQSSGLGAAGVGEALAAAAPTEPKTLASPAPGPLRTGAASTGVPLGVDAGDDQDVGAETTASTTPMQDGHAPSAEGAPTAAGQTGSASGSAAQPLLAAVSGAGATLVKAQGGPTATALRNGLGSAARDKATSSTSGQAVKAADASAAAALPAPPPSPTTPELVAAISADKPAADDASGADDDADEASPGNPDAAGTAVATGFNPGGTTSTANPLQAGGSATPLSASAADLAAQMAAKVVSGSSRFQLQLNPLGMGRVDVAVSIGSNRQLTASLSFADPQTASALSAHAGELKTALEQAGFSVPNGGFDFTGGAGGASGGGLQQGGFGSSGGGDGSASSERSGRLAGAAFGAGEALAAADTSNAWTAGGDSRLDIRI